MSSSRISRTLFEIAASGIISNIMTARIATKEELRELCGHTLTFQLWSDHDVTAELVQDRNKNGEPVDRYYFDAVGGVYADSVKIYF